MVTKAVIIKNSNNDKRNFSARTFLDKMVRFRESHNDYLLQSVTVFQSMETNEEVDVVKMN